MDKIRDSIIPVNGSRCSILVICISSRVGDEASEELIGYNTPIVALTTAAPVLDVMPPHEPCVAYWPLGLAFGDMQWYRIHRNHHLDIVMPNIEPNLFRFDMNMVISVIY